MRKNRSDGCSVISVFAYLAILALMSGCATNRSQVDLKLDATPNASVGSAVKIVLVTDKRVFESAPRDPSTPSLKDGKIHDKAITSRAVGRKRNVYGKALGDVLLPKGRTVDHLVAEALTRAFREAGYRVLAIDDPDYARAIPVTVTVNEFWAWSTVGNKEFRSDVLIEGDIASLRASGPVQGKAHHANIWGTDGEWMDLIVAGLEDLIKNSKATLGKS